MDTPECHFVAMSKVTLKSDRETQSSKLMDTSITLKLSENLDPSYYYKDPKEGLFTLPAVKVITQAFVQGLVANVKAAHHDKMWNEAEHMRYIFDELGKSFATVTNDPRVGKNHF